MKIFVSQKRIIFAPTNSFYQVLSAEAYSKHGFSIYGAVATIMGLDRAIRCGNRSGESVYADFGMNATTAFNVFARAVVRERKIPFEIQASEELTRADGMNAFLDLRAQAQANGVQDLALEEISEEIMNEYNEVL